MEDTSLMVSYTDLSEDGDTLVTNCSTINENINGIFDVLGQDWSSWIGEDKAAYVDSIRDFARLLSTYSQEVGSIGEFMKNAASNYSIALANCKGGIDDNE